MAGEIVDHTPVEIFVHIAEAVALLRKEQHVKTLSGTDQGICHTQRIARMDIVVDVTMYEHQMTFQSACDLFVRLDVVDESRITLFADHFLHAMMRLAPPTVIDAVIMVSGTRDGCLEEVGILQYGSRRHKAATRMAVDTDTVDVDE